MAKDNFIYFLGGGIPVRYMRSVTDAGRYDINKNTWDKKTDLQEPRKDAYGCAAYGRIFVAGGCEETGEVNAKTYELYNELTNEWQYIAAPSKSLWSTCMCVNDKVYSFLIPDSDKVECYDSDSNSRVIITRIPAVLSERHRRYSINICSMRVLKSRDFLGGPMHVSCNRKRKCAIM